MFVDETVGGAIAGSPDTATELWRFTEVLRSLAPVAEPGCDITTAVSLNETC